jgi:DNA (cytosine-5)-methyltransferase 1
MLKFIDLFAGIGGFHLALKRLGHECVFACEIDETLADLYEQNFNIKPEGDIKKVNIDKIPDHDILCAGFPCQPFSKAGKMQGSTHYYGDLFEEIVRILKAKRPNYIFLENVSHLRKQEGGIIWKNMSESLVEIGYEISSEILSPHQFGVPQHRQRVYIVGSLKGLKNFHWIKPQENLKTDIKDVLDINPSEAKLVGKEELICLEVWQEFIDCIPKDIPIPKFPIWAMEFGATYPIENDKIPTKLSEKELGNYRGVFGKSFEGLSRAEQEKLLPSYAFNTDKHGNYQNWKKRYIMQSRDFYSKYETELKEVVNKISKLPVASWHKLEWNAGNGERQIKGYIIQFRASGIRLKKTETSPSLVCTNTQIPIIGWEDRYITKVEGARLQSIENIILPDNHGKCFKALGNAVNVEIVYRIAKQLTQVELENKTVKYETPLNLFTNEAN